MSLIELRAEEFSEIIQVASEKSFLQSVEMADLLKKRGFNTHFLAYRTNDQYKVAALAFSKAMTGGLYMELNSGPVCLDEAYLQDFYRALKDYAHAHGVLELVVKPYQTYQTFDKQGYPLNTENPKNIHLLTHLGFTHDGLQTGYPNGEPVWHFVKDLTNLDKTNLISSFNSNGKRLIKKGYSYPITIRPLKREELSIFKDIQDATSERRGYQNKKLDYYQDFYDCFKNNVEFLVATINFKEYSEQLTIEKGLVQKEIYQLEKDLTSKKIQTKLSMEKNKLSKIEKLLEQLQTFLAQGYTGDTAIASNLIIYTKQETCYLFGGFYPQFKQFNAPYLLQEYAMQQTIDKRIPLYNFLGITGDFDGSDGVLRFKQNFNGSILRKMGTFRYYPNPIKFKALQLLKKLLRR
ncbi:peptidoglycan bridge formation glycyltransferase FemA/FemB family protein [Streptococcus suis]|nr:aminoacyltransferase [Streptococcus suis]MBY5039610.1 aminoacyltransferase [Streptococcus suis]